MCVLGEECACGVENMRALLRMCARIGKCAR